MIVESLEASVINVSDDVLYLKSAFEAFESLNFSLHSYTVTLVEQ